MTIMRIDRILCSKRVFTGLTDSAEELAIAVSGDKIAFVGPKEDALALAREADENAEPEVVDYGDAFIAPGFHDSHVHFFHSAVYSSPLATNFLGDNEAAPLFDGRSPLTMAEALDLRVCRTSLCDGDVHLQLRPAIPQE